MSRRSRRILLAACGVLLGVLSCLPAPRYEPDSVHVGTDGRIYLHSASANLVYVYDLAKRRYVHRIDLAPGSLAVAYNGAEHVLYVSYPDGRITRIDLEGDGTEADWATLPGPAEGLSFGGSLLFADRYVLDSNGTILDDDLPWSPLYADFEWSAAAGRAFLSDRSDVEPKDVSWIAVDPVSGRVGAGDDSPYHGDFPVRGPLRASRDGTRLLTGAGLIYDTTTLEVRDALAVDPVDAVWLDDGLVTLSETEQGDTQLDHWNAARTRSDRVIYPGRPVAIEQRGTGFAIVTQRRTRPSFRLYVPSADLDGDGVANEDDAFPNDRAASLDTDLDGWPDAWNPEVETDGTSLALDAFPANSACWLPEHGSGGVCDVAAAIPAFDPDEVVVGTDGIAYLLSTEHGRVFRWSLAESRHLDPIVTDGHPHLLAYSATSHRLYLAYEKRAITAIDLDATLDERLFGTTFAPASSLAVAGSSVVVGIRSNNPSLQSFAPDGMRATWRQIRWGSVHWAWSPTRGRLFHLRDGLFPDDVLWDSVDAATGVIGAGGDSPYHGDFEVSGPVRLSADETRLLLGSGDFYDTATLEVVASLPIAMTDAAWPSMNTLLTLRAGSDGNAVLERWDAERHWAETAHYAGEPRRILAWSGGATVLTLDAGRLRFAAFVASDDSDGDGVSNTEDAFPLDPAASLDSDRDGRPDAWNPGRGPDDSTTGLTLDAFPLDSACWLASQGTGGVCDVGAVLPAHRADRVEIGQDDVAYLLDRSESRIFRWSAASEEHLDPIVIGPGARDMAYSVSQDRVYVGYDDGRITWFDPSDPARENSFAVLHSGILSLTTFADFLFAASDAHWSYSFRNDGGLVERRWIIQRRDSYEWSAATSRLYTTCDLRDCSPADVHWLSADASTGVVQGGGDSPYHGGIQVRNPIRVEAQGARLLDGTGQVWSTQTHRIVESLPWPMTDAHWNAGRLLVLHADSERNAIVEQLDPITLESWNSTAFAGEPQRLLSFSDGVVVVTQIGDRPAYYAHRPLDDVDDDGAANLDDAFPTDPAASIDGDADGAPEAWNPGFDAEDSSLGLTLDAFPGDFACQLPQHGVAGRCDFAWIVPPAPSEPLCSIDDVANRGASGSLTVPASVDVIPLCDGWVAYGDVENERLVIQDVFSGRLGLVVRLGGKPVDLELDPTAKRIYVAEQDSRLLEQVDLVTGHVARFAFTEPVRAVEADTGSKWIVSTTPWTTDSGRRHYRVDVDTGVREGPVDASLDGGTWNPARQEFVRYFWEGTLARTRLDFPSTFTPIQSTRWGSRGESVALSPDRTQIAYGSREAGGNSIAHYASDALDVRLGVFRGADFPWGLRFDPTGRRLAASSNASLQIFDVATYALVDQIVVAPCTNGRLREVGFSRGGAMVFAKQECGSQRESRAVHWMRVD